MATYKEIKGTNIEIIATDPSNPVEGQVWYNTTSNQLKGQAVTAAGSWATGSALNTARAQFGGAGANTEAALAFGGSPPPAPSAKNNTESWNGSSWTEVNNLNEAKAFVAGAGTYTSAIAAGGDQYSGTAESWNGTNWTNITDEPNASNGYGTAGADSTNALFFGGSPAGGKANTRYWNGSSWAELNDLNTARANLAGSGKTYTAALAFGGITNPSSFVTNTESFNGTNWTAVNTLNTGRAYLGGVGTQTSGLAFAGYATTAVTAKTEAWNGTNWTEDGDLNTARSGVGNAGAGADNTAALCFGGNTGSDTGATEEWTGAGAPQTRTFTVS
jgi:hypothetical protein